MWRKKKRTIECDKRIVKYDVGTAQRKDETVKWEKKNKGTIECDKRTVICDIGIA